MAGDLNLKKSWNPALVKNQSKVWEDEQAKLTELKKIREINSELQKEQEYKRLLQLQHGEEFSEKDLNKGEKLKLNKLNWMYEDMPFESDPASEKTNEGGFIEHNTEFLEGKAQVENLLQGKKSFKRDQGSGDNISRILNVGKTTVGAPSSRKDDPLLMIKRERMQVARGNNGLRKPSSSEEVEPSTKRHSSGSHSESTSSDSKNSYRSSEQHGNKSTRERRSERGSHSRSQHSSKILSGGKGFSEEDSSRTRDRRESSSRGHGESSESRRRKHTESGESRKREHSDSGSRRNEDSSRSKHHKSENHPNY